MADDAAAASVREENDDAATPASSFCLVECKTEPCTDLINPADEELSVFDESTLHIPVSIPMIKNPIVLLERCDKIWKTLQLIRNMQIEKSAALTDDCDKNEEEKEEEKEEAREEEKEAQCLDKVKEAPSYIRYQPRRNDHALPLPFKFSVQRTRKVYPCTTCGKQYLERRSLRYHSERIHGVVLPLQRKGPKRWNRTVLKKKREATSVASIGKESNSAEKLYDNKDSREKITTKTKPTRTATTSPPTSIQFVKCTLCQQKVPSLRKHLINYHKIGGPSSVVEQLESSLLSETTSSENERTISTNKSHQDGHRIMDNESNARGKSRVKRKTTHTSQNARKKLKLNNEPNAFVPPAITQQKQNLVVHGRFKCNICLGRYSSTHSLAKHKRIHKFRGETKENFHKFQCRYFNSPFSKRYKSSIEAKSSTMSVNTVAKNTSDINKSSTSFNQTPKINRATRYSERMRKNEETTCICGRLFRNPHTLFIHKKHCELCQNDDTTTQDSRVSSDRDSGIGLNITIKKRNDSYEIVGKDDEDKSQKSETSNFEEDTSSLSHASNYTKDFTKAFATQRVLDTSQSSKYSKDHSILKLQDTDEDVIIDIEDDLQISPNEDSIAKQVTTREDGKRYSSKRQNDDAEDGKTERVFNKVITLKQMCQEVLEVLEMGEHARSRNTEDKNKKYSQIKDQETCKENSQVKKQVIHQGKRKLRAKRYQYTRVELDHSYGTKVDMTHFDPLMCAYCKERFSTSKSYDNHQCTVNNGRSFDEFSLRLLCFCCKEVLNNYNEFDAHVRIKHFDKAYHCYHCPERFTHDKARLQHFHSEHNDLLCRFCNKKISISAKAFHEGYHLGFGYPCHKCKKAYTNNKNLYYHKQTIHSRWADSLMTCTICLKCVKFKTFKGHMKAHKHNTCYFCGKMFSDRVGLEYHTMMQHGTNVKLKCYTCGTRFHTKKQLEMHEQIDGCNNDIHKMKKKGFLAK
ncbi:uncharacterized protein LOC143905137 [Temnothorax americanus]|uniref:uncharacterized protein LOC143905137 n=1 Tax=Temnothorax americanus TaxID=1964332 RepID=UPI0040694C7B